MKGDKSWHCLECGEIHYLIVDECEKCYSEAIIMSSLVAFVPFSEMDPEILVDLIPRENPQ